LRADKKTILKIEKLKVLKDEPKSKAITRNIFEALQIQTILNILDEGRFHVPFVGNFFNWQGRQ